MIAIRTQSRFAAVGLTCAALHNLIMITLGHLQVHFAISTAISFVLVALTGYALHVRITFAERASVRSLLRYVFAMSANYPLTVALLFLLCDLAKLSINLAAPLATLAMFAWNYTASRWAIHANGAPSFKRGQRPWPE
jgi:putative flippase GtrA